MASCIPIRFCRRSYPEGPGACQHQAWLEEVCPRPSQAAEQHGQEQGPFSHHGDAKGGWLLRRSLDTVRKAIALPVQLPPSLVLLSWRTEGLGLNAGVGGVTSSPSKPLILSSSSSSALGTGEKGRSGPAQRVCGGLNWLHHLWQNNIINFRVNSDTCQALCPHTLSQMVSILQRRVINVQVNSISPLHWVTHTLELGELTGDLVLPSLYSVALGKYTYLLYRLSEKTWVGA